jgi:TonB family protein
MGLRAEAWLLTLLLVVVSCTHEPEPPRADGSEPVPLPVRVFADTGRGGRLLVRAPTETRVWLARVAPTRVPLPSPDLPVAPADSFPRLDDSPPALRVDPGLKPPVPRALGTLTLPPGWTRVRGSVELDVHVDERGQVTEAVWAAGSRDSALVSAARRCALGMRFFPALREGRPVAVWCRQRFDLGASAP